MASNLSEEKNKNIDSNSSINDSLSNQPMNKCNQEHTGNEPVSVNDEQDEILESIFPENTIQSSKGSGTPGS